MTTSTISPRSTKPDASEFLPYYGRYIQLVPEGDVVKLLGKQMKDTQALLGGIPSSMSQTRYEPGKWTVNEVVGHMIDCERIFAARALRFGRNDSTPLPGFEQDDYVANASFNACALSDLNAELKTVRESTIFFFNHLDDAAWLRRGTASGAEVTVRALAYIIAGHELHHRAILAERYLPLKPGR